MGHRTAVELGGARDAAERLGKRLSLAQWLGGLRDLAQACSHVGAADQAELIRRMRELLARAPEPALRSGLAVPDVAGLEAQLDAQCWESAALSMLGDDTGCLLSRSRGGSHLATVVLDGTAEETIAAGHTLALALIGAMALALPKSAAASCEASRSGTAGHMH